VCVHFQTVLGEPQVKISKHLAYLRERGLVECERQGELGDLRAAGETVARAGGEPSLPAGLVRGKTRSFRRDLARLKKIEPSCAWVRAGEPEKAPGQVRCGC